ncbi:S41 family peptidase [Sphingobacterium lumbrici]|uniref:S41 family peptidase n=1 Tax=Sphingobacterium lumbrici TaxID=2559600 RepID=UPI00112CC712|nr:S41 family peptidase [Sphingobacterium lumbrici]
MKKYVWLILGIGFLGILQSCKKNPTKIEDPVEVDKGPESEFEKKEAMLKDSVFYYTKLLSLWQDYMPPRNVNDITNSSILRSYTSKYGTAEDVLDFLIALTPNDPSTNKPIDRFSFLDRGGLVSGEIQNAVATNYGMYVFYLQTPMSGNNAHLYVRMVDVNSPAYEAGIRRGDRILLIDNKSNLDYNSQQSQGFKGISEALNSSSMKVRWVTPDSKIIEKTITSSLYNFNPILSDKVFDVNDKKVGYLAFSSFVNIENKGVLTKMYTDFQTIFHSFEQESITELIVDLRYNGGGAVNTAEYLADKIAPSSADGKKKFYYKLNEVLEEWEWTEPGEEFAPVYFDKSGSLNLSKVYFLVSRSTASASELLINSLVPYMNVQIIGPEKTYGKPVGFFGLYMDKEKSVELYATSFQMFNANDFGDYFDGLTPNKITYEDFFKEFGDPEEGLISEALYHIKNNKYHTGSTGNSASSSKEGLLRDKTINIKNIGERAHDYGMFKFKGTHLKIK